MTDKQMRDFVKRRFSEYIESDVFRDRWQDVTACQQAGEEFSVDQLAAALHIPHWLAAEIITKRSAN